MPLTDKKSVTGPKSLIDRLFVCQCQGKSSSWQTFCLAINDFCIFSLDFLIFWSHWQTKNLSAIKKNDGAQPLFLSFDRLFVCQCMQKCATDRKKVCQWSQKCATDRQKVCQWPKVCHWQTKSLSAIAKWCHWQTKSLSVQNFQITSFKRGSLQEININNH